MLGLVRREELSVLVGLLRIADKLEPCEQRVKNRIYTYAAAAFCRKMGGAVGIFFPKVSSSLFSASAKS